MTKLLTKCFYHVFKHCKSLRNAASDAESQLYDEYLAATDYPDYTNTGIYFDDSPEPELDEEP